jgi:TrmH family RNA methyltransferase
MENIYESKLPQDGIIVMGNEANGISKEIESYVSQRLSIPRFGIQNREALMWQLYSYFKSEFKRCFLVLLRTPLM